MVEQRRRVGFVLGWRAGDTGYFPHEAAHQREVEEEMREGGGAAKREDALGCPMCARRERRRESDAQCGGNDGLEGDREAAERGSVRCV